MQDLFSLDFFGKQRDVVRPLNISWVPHANVVSLENDSDSGVYFRLATKATGNSHSGKWEFPGIWHPKKFPAGISRNFVNSILFN